LTTKKNFSPSGGNEGLPDKRNQELLKRIEEGDAKAQEEILLLFKDKIAEVVLYKIGKKNQDYEDLVGEIRLAILESLRNGQYDISLGKSLQSYVYGIIHNKIRHFRTMKKKHHPNGEEFLPLQNPHITDQSALENQQYRELLLRAIHRLPERSQIFLKLRFFEEMTFQEIGELLEISPQRVREGIHYALKKLRNIWRIKF